MTPSGRASAPAHAPSISDMDRIPTGALREIVKDQQYLDPPDSVAVAYLLRRLGLPNPMPASWTSAAPCLGSRLPRKDEDVFPTNSRSQRLPVDGCRGIFS